VFVECIWPSVKYERMYLLADNSARAARADLAVYIDWYNPGRGHLSLAGKILEQAWLAGLRPCHEAA